MAYDEDLHENHFFKALVETNNALYSKAADNKWLICVPRSESVYRLKLSKNDFENHVLVPHDEDGTLYRSVNNKFVAISSGGLTTRDGYKDSREVKILFEETFFNQRDESYRVLCLEQPLEGAILDEPVVVELESLEDCVKFLWSDSNTYKTRKKIDGLLGQFSLMEHEHDKPKKTRIQVLVDVCRAFFAHALQFASRDGNIRKQIHGSGVLKKALYQSIETYIMSQVYRNVFKEVCVQRSGQDAELNLTTRKLSDVIPHQLGVKAHHQTNLSDVRDKLSLLNNYRTPLEKLVCIKVAIGALHDPATKSSEAMTADELLSVFIYLIITCDIPNWSGNLVYIKGFSLSQITSEDHIYLLTSLEAGLQYISSNQLLSATSTEGKSLDSPSQVPFIIRSDSMCASEKSDVEVFFEAIINNDIAKVRALLNKDRIIHDNVDFTDFCHPLCECERCEELKRQQREEEEEEDETDSVTVYSRGEHGRTGLHQAARKGHVDIIQLLLDNGSSPVAPDNHGSTPLHLACQKGHQRAALLLLGSGAEANKVDITGNTVLHLACSYGHIECVKALLFHTASTTCDINSANDVGDTPLHRAARWGYAQIVILLLEHRANPLVRNKENEMPYHCAYHKKVQDILLPFFNPAAAMAGNHQRSATISHLPASGDIKDKLHHANSSIGAKASTMDRTRPVSSSVLRSSPTQPPSPITRNKLDRLIKKLLKAGSDGDLGMVKYLLHWNNPAKNGSNDVTSSTLVTVTPVACHPLCDCDDCIKKKLSVNTCDTDGVTLLHQACLHGHRKLVELLLDHNVNINVKTTTDQLTPLHYVCQYNHKDIVLLLLETKAKLNPQDVHLNTPLHFCCNNGHMESATLLMIHGANVNLPNERGDTPLHNAAKWNHSELVHELLLYGAQPMKVNEHGLTAFDVTKSEDCQRTLLEAREGIIEVGIHATKPGDIDNFSSSQNKFDSSPAKPIHGNHDNMIHSPTSDTSSWDVIESPSPSTSKRRRSFASSNIFKDIESYDKSVSLEGK